MSLWYYSSGTQPQGPMSAEDLRACFQLGQITPDTLVWREGMEQWRPLYEMSGELPLGDPASLPLIHTAAVEPTSPYAAPSAPVALHTAPVEGGEVVLAGFWKRMAALTIDSLILGVLMMILIMLSLLVFGGAAALNFQSFGDEMAHGALGIVMVVLMYGVPLIIQAVYFTWMHASASQATLGKMAVGIKVTRGNGEGLSLQRSLGRWAAYFFLNLVSCGITSLASAFTAGLTERKQALHDMMADTLVVDRWAFTAHPERQRRELGTVTWIAIVIAALMIVGYFALILFSFGMAVFNATHFG